MFHQYSRFVLKSWVELRCICVIRSSWGSLNIPIVNDEAFVLHDYIWYLLICTVNNKCRGLKKAFVGYWLIVNRLNSSEGWRHSNGVGVNFGVTAGRSVISCTCCFRRGAIRSLLYKCNQAYKNERKRNGEKEGEKDRERKREKDRDREREKECAPRLVSRISRRWRYIVDNAVVCTCITATVVKLN